MYLLLTRCHNNMSPINEKYERHKDSKSVRSLFEQIKPLYGRVYLKWIAYCSSLTEQENHKTEMLKDFFTKRIWKAENDMKDKFLTGIEGIDYSKEDQIKYTYSAYIATVMNDLQGSGTVVKSVQAQLQKYK